MTILEMKNIDLTNKRVLIREDFNVPMENGKITSDARIQAALSTIQFALNKNAAVILMSHLGRPTEGEFNSEFSLQPVAARLSQLLDKPVKFLSDWIDRIEIKPGEIVLCENVRLQIGEKKNDVALAQKIAALCDVFVMDAFATAHRAEASTVGVAAYAPIACAGLLLSAELKALNKALENPKQPLVAIIGGSKVSTKLTVLENLLTKVNKLIVGGGIANTFLAARNLPIGQSLYEKDLIEITQQLWETAKQQHVEIIMPTDVVVATEFSASANPVVRHVMDVKESEMILDVGPQTRLHYADILMSAGTILWNGPVGVFELTPFEQGTKALSLAIAESPAFSIAGGGDTLAAIEKYCIADKISYISTGGGAFLEFVEGKELPAVKILRQE